jgi:hypothetical protein
MYTFYIRESDSSHGRHVGVLYTEFHRACDALDELIQQICSDFQPPIRGHIKERLDLKHTAVYFISQETGDKFTLCDLPVIE